MNLDVLLKNSGHKQLLPLQEATIDAFKKNDHVQLLAQTGSGKTIAFLLATLQHFNPKEEGAQILILSPTRELTIQVTEVLKALRAPASSSACYGGHPVKIEKNELSQHPNIIIATPGRLLDHLKREHLQLDNCHQVVIDEFDKCLEFGFEKEMNEIRKYLPNRLKSLFVSATSLKYIPSEWKESESKQLHFSENKKPTGLKLWKVDAPDTFQSLTECIHTFGKEQSVIFCNYREVVEDVSNRLIQDGISCIAYHGGMDQPERELALIKFRNGSANTLVCTDLGARGLDIENVKHVIHYQFPGTEAEFIHRNGRTARAENDGNAYILHNDKQGIPEYLDLPENSFKPNSKATAQHPVWTTLYFNAGKKDKLRKLDIVGFLSQQGKLQQDEIGKIDILDHMAYAAVATKKFKKTMDNIHMKRIKGKRIVIKKAK